MGVAAENSDYIVLLACLLWDITSTKLEQQEEVYHIDVAPTISIAFIWEQPQVVNGVDLKQRQN